MVFYFIHLRFAFVFAWAVVLIKYIILAGVEVRVTKVSMMHNQYDSIARF